jgi:hypothetical protein
MPRRKCGCGNTGKNLKSDFFNNPWRNILESRMGDDFI